MGDTGRDVVGCWLYDACRCVTPDEWSKCGWPRVFKLADRVGKMEAQVKPSRLRRALDVLIGRS